MIKAPPIDPTNRSRVASPDACPDFGARFAVESPEMSVYLSDPRVAEAFRHMITDPAASAQYLRDPEIGRIMRAIGMHASRGAGRGGEGEEEGEEER